MGANINILASLVCIECKSIPGKFFADSTIRAVELKSFARIDAEVHEIMC